MTTHPAKWTAPAPLWPDILVGPEEQRPLFGSPAILRFAEDDFMERFLAVLERSPGQIADFLAVHETWEAPAPAPKALALIEPAHVESKLSLKLRRLKASGKRMISPRALPGRGAPAKPLKLFHPAHQRFYLVTASLVCGFNGLTDHKIDSSHREQAGFVVRRLLPEKFTSAKQEYDNSDPTGWDEYAFVPAAGGGGWQRVPPSSIRGARRMMPGEELLPLFPVHYREDDGRKRRVLAGTIPTARRDAYLAAPRLDPPDGAANGEGSRPKTARLVFFRTKVAEPWKSLIERAEGVRQLLYPADADPMTGEEREAKQAAVPDLLRQAREQLQVVSWYVLLDFARYLWKYLPGLWEVVASDKGGESLTSNAERNLLLALDATAWTGIDLLKGTGYDRAAQPVSLRDALRKTAAEEWAWEKKLENVTEPYHRDMETPADSSWPDFLFPLADPEARLAVNLSQLGKVDDLGEGDGVDTDIFLKTEEDPPENATAAGDPAVCLRSVDQLVALVARALPKDDDQPSPPIPLAASKVTDLREGWFLIRCVYERPNCGPLHPPELSLPTAAFQMAGFFDPDAPARPIRIGLPIDTTPAGLRKFDKNTAFMISDILCGQMKRAKGISLGDLVRSVLPWPFHKDLPVPEGGPCGGKSPFGMICTLSIPIITLAALILLTIIVSVLDIIFRWIPFFIVCFPVPGFRGKKEGG